MSGESVRRQFMKEFRGFKQNDRIAAGAIVASYVTQIILAVGFGCWLFGQGLAVWEYVALAGLVFFIATRLRGFNNIVHECSHNTFTNTRNDNTFYGSLCAALVFSCFRDYRDEHLTHHAHLGDYDHDMDLHGIEDLRLEEPLTPKTVMRHILTPLFGLHLPYYLKINLSAKDGLGFLAVKFLLIGLMLLATLTDPVMAFVLLWLPVLWVYPALNYWTDCIDHGGLLESGDELEASRNVILPRPLAALLFPRNDCYHLVHHLFPQVPTQYYEECHEKLLSNPAYSARNASDIVIGKTQEV